jgi:tRNA 2-selenouridine synthase SelU
MKEQPTTQQFENILAESLDSFQKNSATEIWLEAESSNLGKCRIPNSLYTKMKEAPIIEIIKEKDLVTTKNQLKNELLVKNADLEEVTKELSQTKELLHKLTSDQSSNEIKVDSLTNRLKEETSNYQP